MVVAWPFGVRGEVRRDEAAVSEVVGTVLLVAITIIMAGGFALMLGAFGGPTEKVHAELETSISQGGGAWGTGDEVVQVAHRGGGPLQADETRIVVRVGATEHVFAGDDLAGPFADGTFTIGETWSATLSIPTGTNVEVAIGHAGTGGTTLITGATHVSPGTVADCSGDTSPPTVSAWTQTPADLDNTHDAGVTVRATLTDDCAGVYTSAAPVLEYRITPDTAYTVVGTMAHLSGTTWQATIPDPDPAGSHWAAHTGQTLWYRLTGMTDFKGNVGTSVERSDFIQDPAATTFTYPDSPPSVGPGTVSDYANLLDDSDGGAFAAFTQTEVTSSGPTTYTGPTADAASTASDPSAATGAPDGQGALLVDGDKKVIVTGYPAVTGTISKVEVLIEARSASGSTNDDLCIMFYVSGSSPATCTGDRIEYDPGTSFGEQVWDVTSFRSWTGADIGNLKVQGHFKMQGGDSTDYYVDSLRVRVTASSTIYELDAQMNFTAVSGGAFHDLQIQYQTSVNPFLVEVQQSDGSWVQRGATLTSPTVMTSWSYTLTPDEYQGGGPKIRIVESGSPTAQGSINIDYLRVRTT